MESGNLVGRFLKSSYFVYMYAKHVLLIFQHILLNTYIDCYIRIFQWSEVYALMRTGYRTA